MDPFLLNVIKNPLSFPSIMLFFSVLSTIVFTKITITIIRNYKKELKESTKSIRNNKLIILAISIIIFILSSFLLFYKMTDIPPSGLDIDDGIYVVAAHFLKTLGYDSHNAKIPYYSLASAKYHGWIAWEVGQRAVAVYLMTFLHYFVEPGYFMLRLTSTLLVFFTTIFLIYTCYLLTKSPITSILFGSLFNTLPWARILARITPETTAYCFGAACFLFCIIYLFKTKGKLAFLLYLTSLVMFFQSYTPALMFTPLCIVFIPIVASKYSTEYRSIRNLMVILGIATLALIYFQFKGEEGYRYNLGRANAVGCLPGLNTLDFPQIFESLKENGKTYIANYIAYFMPQFLFFSGDGNLRHNTGFGGQMFAVLCIAFYAGLFYLIEKRKEDPDFRLLLGYLLISAIPYSICLEGALNSETKLPLHALRQSAMLPAVSLIIIIGLLRIFNKSKVWFFVYLVFICTNIYFFYQHYFNVYPVMLGNSAVDDPGLRKASNKAIEILKKHPEKKLFYRCNPLAVVYHNIKEIGTNAIFNGDGILSNVYDYEQRGDVKPQVGDIFLVQEPFDYGGLKKNHKHILQLEHPYLPGHIIGVSLFEITK